jgi:phasin
VGAAHLLRRPGQHFEERHVATFQPSFEIPTEMRDFAEKSVEQARGAVTTFVQTARKATESMQNMTKSAELPASVAFSRGLDFTEQNVAAAFDLAQKLVRARDVQEAMQIQSEYVRAQFAALQTQAKELASTVQPAKA